MESDIETLKAELRRQLETGNASTAQLTQNTMRRSA